MSKIKNQTNATLDRMAILQQRYRQHQEIMKSGTGSDQSRRTSTTSLVDDQHVSLISILKSFSIYILCVLLIYLIYITSFYFHFIFICLFMCISNLYMCVYVYK